MALYDETVPWLFGDYSLRRRITLEPDALIPGQESLCSVTIDLDHSLADHGSYIVVKGEDKFQSYWLHSLEDNLEHVVFKAENPILSTNTDYYLYYGTPFRYIVFDSDPLFLSSEMEMLEDIPFTPESKWSFLKPTIDWSNTTSIKVGASATFAFSGHRAILTLANGPDHGQARITVNDNIPFVVDCYAGSNGFFEVDVLDSNDIRPNRIHLEVLGTSSIHSSGHVVTVVNMKYHQILEGTLGPEELPSLAGSNYNVGQ